jgi:hypothetical protein
MTGKFFENGKEVACSLETPTEKNGCGVSARVLPDKIVGSPASPLSARASFEKNPFAAQT